MIYFLYIRPMKGFRPHQQHQHVVKATPRGAPIALGQQKSMAHVGHMAQPPTRHAHGFLFFFFLRLFGIPVLWLFFCVGLHISFLTFWLNPSVCPGRKNIDTRVCVPRWAFIVDLCKPPNCCQGVLSTNRCSKQVKLYRI